MNPTGSTIPNPLHLRVFLASPGEMVEKPAPARTYRTRTRWDESARDGNASEDE
jgi:nitrite reductase/ring-hydroxylating ferredoxin subunit